MWGFKCMVLYKCGAYIQLVVANVLLYARWAEENYSFCTFAKILFLFWKVLSKYSHDGS
jgi:hypothetical protein